MCIRLVLPFVQKTPIQPDTRPKFWMVEPEMAFADLQDDMRMAEAMVKYVIGYVLERAAEEMKFL